MKPVGCTVMSGTTACVQKPKRIGDVTVHEQGPGQFRHLGRPEQQRSHSPDLIQFKIRQNFLKFHHRPVV